MDGRLKTKGGGLRVDANRQMIHDDSAGVVRNGENALLVGLGRQHVQVGDQEKTFILILECETMPVAPHKMAKMEFAGGAISGQNSFACRCVTHRSILLFLLL